MALFWRLKTRIDSRLGMSLYVALCGAITLQVVCVPDAWSQEKTGIRTFGPGFRTDDPAWQPTVHRRDLARYSDVLQLDETQRLIVDDMLSGYGDRYRAAAELIKQQISNIEQEAKATGDFRAYSDGLTRLVEDWMRMRNDLEQELFGEIRLVLLDEQLALWPKFEREQRRVKALPNGRLGGEDIDLVMLVRDLDLSDDTMQKLADTMDRYAEEMDAALSARDAVLPGLEEQWRDSFGDRDMAARIWEKATDKRSVVRDVNVRYLAIVASMLPGDVARELEYRFEDLSYPLVHEDTKADRLFTLVEDLESLSTDQAAQIAAIQMNYKARRQSLNQKLVNQLRREERELPPFIRNMRIGYSRNRTVPVVVVAGGEDDQHGGLLKDRFELSKGTVESVESVLTPQQRESLPQIDLSDLEPAFFRGPRMFL